MKILLVKAKSVTKKVKHISQAILSTNGHEGKRQTQILLEKYRETADRLKKAAEKNTVNINPLI